MTVTPRPIPLLRSQIGMRDGHLIDPANSAFNVGFVTWFPPLGTRPPRPELLAEAARRTLAEASSITMRLRRDPDDTWMQVNHPPSQDSVGITDLSGAVDPAAEFDAFITARAQTPFELIGGRLFHCDVIVLEPTRIALCGWAHHIVVDGYGMSLFRSRIVAHFLALMDDQIAPPRYFGDFAELVANERAATDSDVDFWTDHMRTLPTRLTFADRVAAPTQSTLTATIALDRYPATPAHGHDEPGLPALVIGVVAAYVARILDEDEAVVGVPLHNRQTLIERTTPSSLMTELPVRVVVDGAATTSSLAHSVRTELRRIRPHSLVRPERLRESLPSAWRTGLVHGPSVNLITQTPRMSPYDEATTSRFLSVGPVQDMSIVIDATDSAGAVLQIGVNPRTYREVDLTRHIERLGSWIDACLAAPPDHPVAEIPLLTAAERTAHADLRAACRNVHGANETAPTTPHWGDAITADELIALTGHHGAGSIDIVTSHGFPVTFDEVGEVTITTDTTVRTGILAVLDGDGIIYRGPADERVRMRGRWVERGATAPPSS